MPIRIYVVDGGEDGARARVGGVPWTIGELMDVAVTFR